MSTTAVLKKARKKADQASAGASKAAKGAAELVNDYKKIPGYSKYEINSKNVLRNVKTGRVLNPKQANKKYQLISDKGKNNDLSIERIRELLPLPKTNEKIKTSRAKKEVVPFDGVIPKEAQEIIDMDIFKKEKIVRLHLKGYDNKQIENFIGTNQGWIWNEINAYKADPSKFKI